MKLKSANCSIGEHDRCSSRFKWADSDNYGDAWVCACSCHDDLSNVASVASAPRKEAARPANEPTGLSASTDSTTDAIVVRLTEDEIEGLRNYVNWHGGVHTGACPADDTCDCKHKPLNDAVNSICQKAFDAQVIAQGTERCGSRSPDDDGPVSSCIPADRASERPSEGAGLEPADSPPSPSMAASSPSGSQPMYDLIAAIEWAGVSDNSSLSACCPICLSLRVEGHEVDCSLKRLIGEARNHGRIRVQVAAPSGGVVPSRGASGQCEAGYRRIGALERCVLDAGHTGRCELPPEGAWLLLNRAEAAEAKLAALIAELDKLEGPRGWSPNMKRGYEAGMSDVAAVLARYRS